MPGAGSQLTSEIAPPGGPGSPPLGRVFVALFMTEGATRRFKTGHALFHQGQLPDRVLMLRSGHVKVTSTTSGGREIVLAFRGPGDLVGEQSVLDGQPRSATVCAVEPVEALSLGTDEFRRFLAADPDAALTMMQELSRRLRDADAKRFEQSALTTIERVTKRLLEFAERYGADDGTGIRIRLPLTQEELAGATGASIESVERALQTLRALDYITTGRRSIRICDVAALRSWLRAAGA